MEYDKIAIISDIHANIEAFEAVLTEIDKEKVDKIICLGDMVGYGPNPNEVVDLVIEKKITSIKGNHDEGMVNQSVVFQFNEFGRKALKWQRSIIKRTNFLFLESLPFESVFDDFQIVHGAPSNYFKYIITLKDALDEKKFMKKNIVFVGHSHRAGIFSITDKKYFPMPEGGEFILEREKKYIVNSGSVGQPRDLNPDASFMIYYPKIGKVIIKRVKYPKEVTRKKILELGLPEFLGDRLLMGY